ncbi:MAG: sirohydrochlorin cobaltochelatase, partial [Octadecabacter sp.]
TQVLGFESEVGAVQESHHHHVEGQGASAPGSNVADCVLCNKFCTGMCRLEAQHAHNHAHTHGHDHDHQHAVYPHAKHPHGPESARKTKV